MSALGPLLLSLGRFNFDLTGPVFYPYDAMLARVFVTATCPDVRPSVCPSVRHMQVLCLAERKQGREMYTI